MNIMMISADVSVTAGDKGPFYYMLEEFHRHFDRIDVIGLRPAQRLHDRIFGNVFLHHPRRGKLFQPFFIRRTGTRLMRERDYAFAVSHDYNLFYNGLGAYLLHRKSGLPYISEIHHVPGHPRAANLREVVDRICTRFYVRWVQKHALAIRVVNAREQPGLLTGWGVRPDKIKVLYSLYMDFDTYHPQPAPKEYDLMFCGRLVGNKGLFIILDALEILKRERPDARLLVVGRGPLEHALDRRIRRSGLSAHVHRIAWVADTKALAELYRRSRILVCASYNEGGPRVTAEAMACGTPALSTPVGIMPDLIREGENGFLFQWDPSELASKAKALLTDPALYERVRGNLADTVAPFERKKVLADLAEGFKALVKGGSRPLLPFPN
ncbi:MAG: glycosyltransferase [Armatimonadia bacterium]|nr:glycosyltransferase [Armatimonadia bacterium]